MAEQTETRRSIETPQQTQIRLKRMTKEQQDEKDAIELGMLSIMQMHYNETGTEEVKIIM